jgi:hypothetical protein
MLRCMVQNTPHRAIKPQEHSEGTGSHAVAENVSHNAPHMHTTTYCYGL